MIFKPFVLLASALATLQVANGAALAERDTSLCCQIVVTPPDLGPFVGVINVALALLPGAGVTLNTGLDVGADCAALGDPWFVHQQSGLHTTHGLTSTGTAFSCEVAVPSVLGLTGQVGVNCNPV
ncbi:hypothetical protein R3P38DRAFT_3233634 [Favolaschia claudopus]|uniref:Hydrophobin n=1 Tax=Favolaschia claudopus TaxID=2862362 RepID=A0AAV9ZHL3_9AGAR